MMFDGLVVPKKAHAESTRLLYYCRGIGRGPPRCSLILIWKIASLFETLFWASNRKIYENSLATVTTERPGISVWTVTTTALQKNLPFFWRLPERLPTNSMYETAD
jgi:hypothetical protein